MLGAYGFLRAIFEVFERHRTVVDIVATSEVSVSLSLEDTSALDEILVDLKQVGAVKVESGRAIVCIVGEGLRSTPGIAARVFSTIKDINILLISQGASSINLTFVIDERHAEEAVVRLHEAFFECATSELTRAHRLSLTRSRDNTRINFNECYRTDTSTDRHSVRLRRRGGGREFLAAYLEHLGYNVEVQEVEARARQRHRDHDIRDRAFFSRRTWTPCRRSSLRAKTRSSSTGAARAMRRASSPRRCVAAERLRAEGHRRTIGLLFTVDEELGSAGARVANVHPLARACQLSDQRRADRQQVRRRLERFAARRASRRAGAPRIRRIPNTATRRLRRCSTCSRTMRACAWPADEFYRRNDVQHRHDGGRHASRTSSPAEAQAESADSPRDGIGAG